MRQVAMVDATGRVAVHTGSAAIAHAGHQTGALFSVQANLMAKPSVWPAMARAYEQSKGDLAARLLASMQAAEAEGGDARGRQSAVLRIVRAKSTGRVWDDRLFDLRVEDHPNPVQELARLVSVKRAYQHMGDGDLAVEKKEYAAALREYAAANALLPNNAEFLFWNAVALVNMNRVSEATPLFLKAFELHPAWRQTLTHVVAAGLLPKGFDRQLRPPAAPQNKRLGLCAFGTASTN